MESDLYFACSFLRYHQKTRIFCSLFPGAIAFRSATLTPVFDSSRQFPGGFFFQILKSVKINGVIDDKLGFGCHFVRFFPRFPPIRLKNKPRQSIPLEIPQVVFFPDFSKIAPFTRYSTLCPKPTFFPSLQQNFWRGGSQTT